MPARNLKFDKKFKNFEGARLAFLHGAGQIMVNQMAEFAHVDTGTLKNSVTYQLQDGTGSEFGTEGDGVPPDDAKVSRPDREDDVRSGSALNYAGAQEKHNGWASKGFDTVIGSGSLEKLADKIFGKVI